MEAVRIPISTLAGISQLRWALVFGMGCTQTAEGPTGGPRFSTLVDKETAPTSGVPVVSDARETSPCTRFDAGNYANASSFSRMTTFDEAVLTAAREGFSISAATNFQFSTIFSCMDSAWSRQIGLSNTEGDLWISLVSGRTLKVMSESVPGLAIGSQFVECPPAAPNMGP
jgi:hypothetical protein